MGFGDVPPFFTFLGAFGAQGVTGSVSAGWTASRTAVASSAETIWTFSLSEDTSSLKVCNWSASNAVFSPGMVGLASSSNRRTVYGGKCQTDSGATPVVQFDASIGTAVAALAAGTNVATKPLFHWSNNGTVVMAQSAAGALVVSGGSAPALGVGTATWRSGTGTPEGAVTGNVGDMFSRTDGGAGTCLYIKESGAGTNTGWIAK